VPFADGGGGVVLGFEGFGESGEGFGEFLAPVGREEFGGGAFVAGDPVGDVGAGGALSGEEGGAGGGADRAGGEGAAEGHAFLGELVDVGCLVELAAGAGEVGGTHVIDEDDDEVEGLGGGGEGECGAEEEETAEHGATLRVA